MANPIIKLSDKALFDSIKQFNESNGFSPTIRELAGMNGVAVETVHKHLNQLVRDGYIKILPPQRRTLKVLKDYD